MPSKTIKCSNVERKDGQYGPSVKVGYKTPEGWENYYVNGPELFDYFKKGEHVVIDYHEKNGYFVVDGVSDAAPKAGGNGGGASFATVDDAGRQKSIELQVVVKAWAQVKAGTDIMAAEFAADVNSIWTRVFAGPLEAKRAEAQQTLDAKDDPDDDISFV